MSCSGSSHYRPSKNSISALTSFKSGFLAAGDIRLQLPEKYRDISPTNHDIIHFYGKCFHPRLDFLPFLLSFSHGVLTGNTFSR